MSSVATEEIEACLDKILDPCSVGNRTPMSITEMGLIQSIDVDDDGVVTVAMRLTAPACLMVGFFKDEATALIGKLDGVSEVRLTYDAGLDWSPDMIRPAAQERRRKYLEVLHSLPPVG
jgi:metal-sulfur cluster biosynthetic enzyme